VTLGSDHAKPLLFQGLFARERCYLALEPHFPYRNGHHKAALVRCRLRLTQTSDRLVARRPIHDAPFEIVTTMGDVPDKAGHEMTVRAYIKPTLAI
jgi:hypothetical protein